MTVSRHLRPIAVALLALGALGAAANSHPALPRSLLGMPIENEISGEDAARMIAHLHRKQVSGGYDAIGHYGNGPGHAMLYLSHFDSADAAAQRARAMAARVARAETGFGHHRQFVAGGLEVHFVLGEGKVHYFYARGQELYWLAVTLTSSRAALTELAQVPPEEVPTVRELLSAEP